MNGILLLLAAIMLSGCAGPPEKPKKPAHKPATSYYVPTPTPRPIVAAVPLAPVSVNLAWDANTEPDIASYILYSGPQPRTYTTSQNVGNVTTATLTFSGETTYVAVTARNLAQIESAFSNEIRVGATPTPSPTPTATATVPPSPTPPPGITINPATLTFTRSVNGPLPASQSIQITTSSGVNWTAHDTCNWITGAPTGGASGGSEVFNIEANPGPIPNSPDTYTCPLEYRASGLPSRFTTITLIVTGSPTPTATAFATPTPTPTPTPTQTPTPTLTPTPTPTPAVASISGTVRYCSNPVANVKLTLTGIAGGTEAVAVTTTDSNGFYQFSNVPTGASYVLTPSKKSVSPGAAEINTIDVVTIQQQYLEIDALAPCQRPAADVNNDSLINVTDVIAVSNFYLGKNMGIASTGVRYFDPITRTYNLNSDQFNQNFDMTTKGDVVAPFAP